MKRNRVIIFHPMQQHSYKTAEALVNGGYLFQYWTTIYYQPDKFIYKVLSKVLRSDNVKRMSNRTNDMITPYVKTSCSLLGLFFLLSIRLDKRGKITEYLQYILSKRIGRKVAKEAIKEAVSAIIVYDTWAHGVIKELKRKNSDIKIIIDYTSLYAEEIIRIINKDIENNKIGYKPFEKTLNKFAPKYLNAFKYEKDMSDYYLSASSVVDNSLLKYGVSKNAIFRCIYGSYFKRIEKKKKNYSTVTFIYIGRMSYAKGVHYLIDAFNLIERADCRLLLIGENTDNLISRVRNSNIEYVGMVRHDEIPTYLEKADVSISASLYDGFSLAILEGISYNLPVLCTKNTGIVDFVTEDNGISFDIQNIKQIYHAVTLLMDNKEMIQRMSNNVGNILDRLSWDKYYNDVNNAISTVLKRENEDE